ncbi:MAG: hypothetical protein U1F36_02825 [Planctomycetota bacterium]
MASLFRLAHLRVFASAVLVLAAGGVAQQFPLRDGFAARTLTSETAAPWRVHGLAPGLTPGEIYFAVGSSLLRCDGISPPTPVAITPHGGEAGFVVRPRGSDALFYSDFVSSTLVRRDLPSGTETQRAIPQNSFDLETTAQGDVLVAANPQWPGPGADCGVFLLPPGAAPREIVHLVGPSGPLLVDRVSGDLYCAVFGAGVPAPPGSVTIRRFARAALDAAIAGGPTLQLRDASLFCGGLDGAYDLAQDDRGALLVSDPLAGDVRRIAPDGVVISPALIARNPRAALDLVFVDAAAPTLDPWQPDDGGTLLCTTSDFVTAATVHAVTAAAPVVTCSRGTTVPAGAFRIEVSGCATRAAGVLLFDLLPLVARRVIVVHDGVALFSDLDFAIAPIVTPILCDASGHALLDLVNPGGTPLSLTVAAIAAPTRSSDPFAVSAGLFLNFRP